MFPSQKNQNVSIFVDNLRVGKPFPSHPVRRVMGYAHCFLSLRG